MKREIIKILEKHSVEGVSGDISAVVDFEAVASDLIKLIDNDNILKTDKGCKNSFHFFDIRYLGRCKECLETIGL